MVDEYKKYIIKNGLSETAADAIIESAINIYQVGAAGSIYDAVESIVQICNSYR